MRGNQPWRACPVTDVAKSRAPRRAVRSRARARAHRHRALREVDGPKLAFRLPSRTVNPAELRAIGSDPTSTQTVWLPSTMRCSRSHVVNGSCLTRERRRVGDIERDDAEVAGLQHERHRPDRLLERALVHVAARIPGFVTTCPRIHSSAIEIDAGCRGRCDVEHVERIDKRDELAARGGGGQHLQQDARAGRRARTDELRQMTAREPAPQPRV